MDRGAEVTEDGGGRVIVGGGAEILMDGCESVTVGSGVKIPVDEGWELAGGGVEQIEDFTFFLGLAFSPLDLETGYEDDLVLKESC